MGSNLRSCLWPSRSSIIALWSLILGCNASGAPNNSQTNTPSLAEILGFYVHVARFQQGIYQRLQPVSANSSARLPDRPEFAELLGSFPEFLSLVEGKAPAQFAQVARELRNSAPGSWPDLLNQARRPRHSSRSVRAA